MTQSTMPVSIRLSELLLHLWVLRYRPKRVEFSPVFFASFDVDRHTNQEKIWHVWANMSRTIASFLESTAWMQRESLMVVSIMEPEFSLAWCLREMNYKGKCSEIDTDYRSREQQKHVFVDTNLGGWIRDPKSCTSPSNATRNFASDKLR